MADKIDIRCLADAGMPPEMIRTYIEHTENGQSIKATSLLKQWREVLLDHLHTCQRQIDCLDYFLRNMQK